MGMFDYLHYKGHDYQSKDTPNQLMDKYELKENGTLWVEEYDAEWVKDEGALVWCLHGTIKSSMGTGRKLYWRDSFLSSFR
jgi:hypothetical protein